MITRLPTSIANFILYLLFTGDAPLLICISFCFCFKPVYRTPHDCVFGIYFTFHFIPKVFTRVEVRALSRPLKFFHITLGKPFHPGAHFVHNGIVIPEHAWTAQFQVSDPGNRYFLQYSVYTACHHYPLSVVMNPSELSFIVS